jgi:hypothetical protein
MTEEQQAQQAPEVAPPEPAAEAPVAEAAPAPEPEPVAVEPVQEEKKQLEPVAEDSSPEPVKPEVQDVLQQELVNRLGMLEGRIKDYEQKEKEREAQVVKEKVAAREKLLKELGILDDLYGKLAPSIDEADPRTEQGQEAYRQWMVKHPSLFKKSPTLEKIKNATEETERRGNTFRKHLTFSEAIRKIKG